MSGCRGVRMTGMIVPGMLPVIGLRMMRVAGLIWCVAHGDLHLFGKIMSIV